MSRQPNRRDFLHTGTLLAGTALGGTALLSEVNSRAFAAPEKPAGRERSFADRIYKADKGGTIGADRTAMIERLQQYKVLGFDGLEGQAPGIADVNALLDAMGEVDFPVHGVVDSVHWKQRLSSPDPAERDQGRDALEQALRDARVIRASSVLLVPGRVTGDDENHDHVWNRSIAEIRKVLPLAARLGVMILIENVWNGFCETPEELRDYVDEIDSPWVGVYFDIGNVRKFGPSEDWIRTLGSRIVKLDVKDWGQEEGFCRLGEGDVDWAEVRAALSEIDFTGWATREGRDNSLEDTSQLMDELLNLGSTPDAT